MSFETALPLVLKDEGGDANNPLDKGGPTRKGISTPVWNAWLAAHGEPSRSVFTATDAEITAIYRAWYWEAGRCGALPEPVDYVHFDACVNHGLGGPNPKTMGAAELLQRAVGAVEDGIIGPRTLAAVRAEEPYDLAEHYLWVRVRYYSRFPPEQWHAFSHAWMVRMADVHQRLLQFKP